MYLYFVFVFKFNKDLLMYIIVIGNFSNLTFDLIFLEV